MKKRENEEKQTGMTEKHFRTHAVHTHTRTQRTLGQKGFVCLASGHKKHIINDRLPQNLISSLKEKHTSALIRTHTETNTHTQVCTHNYKVYQ